jgi:hypothetical protein
MALRSVFVCALAAAAGLVFVVACGEVTGLSDDYTFDGGGEGASASGDASDGGTESGSTTDAGSCGPIAADAAAHNPTILGASDVCRSCLSQKCCVEVVECSLANDCAKRLNCNAACTRSGGGGGGGGVKDCIANCSDTTPPASYAKVGACADTNCSTTCGFK